MNFISETDVEEAKIKRAEEWAKAREEGRQLPEEEVETFRDTRSLYERLKQQKDRKQEDFEETLKFKNQIYKGLNEDDAGFLDMVSKKQREIDERRFNQESEELQEYRLSYAALEEKTAEVKTADKNDKVKIAEDFKTNKKKSQKDLLGAAIIRKRKSTNSSKDSEIKKKKDEDESKDSTAKPTLSTTPTTKLTALASYSSSEED